MREEKKAERLRERALQVSDSEPRKALDLLVEATRKYPHTRVVTNTVVNDIIDIAEPNGFWDEAIAACVLAQKSKPDYRQDYALLERAFRLDKEGCHVEATEARLEQANQRVVWFGTLRYYGDKFTELGAHDRAWRLYNQAVVMALREKESPHMVRQSMARLLLKENRPGGAVEMMIAGICEIQELEDRVPQTLVTDLRKALRATGFNLRKARFRGVADEIVTACKNEGQRYAIELFHKRREEIG